MEIGNSNTAHVSDPQPFPVMPCMDDIAVSNQKRPHQCFEIKKINVVQCDSCAVRK
jgi:hypothetical protein